MFYVINDLDNPSIDEDDAPFLEIHEELIVNPKRGWQSGSVLEDPPGKKIEVLATPHFGYVGPPPDYYDDSISLMSPRLAKVLKDSGVDNIDLYPVEITYKGSNESYQWFAFNILGLISAVDLDKSTINNSDGHLLIESSIDGFVIDPSKAKGHLMFRLAEHVMVTVVSESIKNAIEQSGINTFSFSNTEDWIQI